MPINSRQKGARGERELAQWFRDNLYDPEARRGQQFAGGTDSPDVILPNIPRLHIEMKFAQRINIYDAMSQSMRDSGTKINSVWFRKKNEELLVILRAAEIDRFTSMWQHDVLTNEYYDRAILGTLEL